MSPQSGTLDFGDALVAESPVAGSVQELVSGAISPEGDLWIAWLDWDGTQSTLRLANEASGWIGEDLSTPTAGSPCECCSIAVRFADDASPTLAWRDNADNIRDMVFGWGDPGDDSIHSWAYATGTHWEVFACPVDGPDLEQTADGTHVIAWADNSSGDYLTYVATSSDGATWSAETAVAPTHGVSQKRPVVAMGPSGTWYLVYEIDGPGSGALVTSTDGVSWSSPEGVAGPTGALQYVAVDGAAGIAAMAGVADSDGIWFSRLE